MDWNIQVLGSFEFVRAVLNGAAMFGSGGAGGYASVAVLGAVIGLLIAAGKAIISAGKELELHIIAVSALLFALMFGSRVEVVVEGVLPGPDGQPQIDRVANVPIGLAVLGHLISNTGLYFAQEMDTAFSTPGSNNGLPLASGGFGRTLELLRAPLALADPRNPSRELAVLRQNVQNYFSACSLRHIRRFGRSESLWTEPDFLAQLRADDQTVVMLRLTQSAPETPHTCSDAWTRLGLNYQVNDPFLRDALNKGMGARVREEGELQDVLEEINTALRSLAVSNLDNIKAERIAVAALAVGAMDVGVIEGLRNDPRAMQSLMMQQASRQRAAQWAAEEGMFLKIIRPMISFFEALTYALAPIMSFLIGFGSFGIRLAAKYLVLPIWVVLWMPLISICNLYTNRMLGAVLERLDASIAGGASLAQIQFLFEETVRIAGVAGLLTAGVPSLAMMLLFGGAVAASAYANRLQGGDHVNEKMVAGDNATPGAALRIDDTRAMSAMTAQAQTGAAGFAYSQSAMGSAMVRSAASRTQSAQQSFGSAIQLAYKDTAGFGLEAKEGLRAAETRAFEESRGETAGFLQSMGVSRDDVARAGLTEREEAQFAQALAGSLSGRDVGQALAGTAIADKLAGMKGRGGAIASVVGSLLSNSQGSVKDTNTMAQGLSKEISTSTGQSQQQVRDLADRYSSQLSHRIGREVVDETGSNAKLAEEIARSNTLGQQLQDVQTAQSAYESARQMANSFGSSQTLPETQAVSALLGSMAQRATPSSPVDTQLDALYSQVASAVGPQAMRAAENGVALNSGLPQGSREATAAAIMRAAFSSSPTAGGGAAHQEATGEISRLVFGDPGASAPMYGAGAYANGNPDQARAVGGASPGDIGIGHTAAAANAGYVERVANSQINMSGETIDSRSAEAMAPIESFGGPPPAADSGIRDRVMTADSPADAEGLDRDVRAAMGEPPREGSVEPQSRLEELHALRQTQGLTMEQAEEYAGLMQTHTFNEVLDLVTPVGDAKALAGAAGDVVSWATGR